MIQAFIADTPRLPISFRFRANFAGGFAALWLSWPVVRIHRFSLAGNRAGNRQRNSIVAHLGSGASLCALNDGKSVDTTLGFTALDGLCMGTRPGRSIRVLCYLFQSLGLSAKEVETFLYKKSGLIGISGISNDMRDLLGRKEPEAHLAVDYFVYRIAKEIGALAAVLGGLDGLVFTAGIGENSPEIRRRVCEASAWLGVEIDEPRTQSQAHAFRLAKAKFQFG